MRKAVCVGLLLMFGCCAPALAEQPTPFAIKQVRKAPIAMDAAAHPRMHVFFDHMQHKGISCFTCHHKKVDNFALVSCDTEGCHVNKDRKSRAKDSYFQAMHSKNSDHSCLGCHTVAAKEKPGLDGCQTCHDAGRLLKANAAN